MLLTVLLLAMSLVAFFAMGADKWKARRNARRIPERVLFLLALPFGAPGAYAGMMVFRHKTRNARFAVGLPILSAAQIIFVLWALFAGRVPGV